MIESELTEDPIRRGGAQLKQAPPAFYRTMTGAIELGPRTFTPVHPVMGYYIRADHREADITHLLEK